MDAATIFRQGMGPAGPRMNHAFMSHPQQQQPPPPPPQQQQQQFRKAPSPQDDTSDGDTSGHRIAHTLTACCRCRQRKTRCDPTLPRCLPCERSGSTCEYLDAAKGRKINRYYVIKLQDRVRLLEAELSQYTDEDNEFPRSTEDMVRPGGMVRLNGGDETPRYLGPSSGIAMTRLLMEEAKRYTDSKRISDLIPSVRARQARMQSIQMTGPAARRKSYPMISQHPAESLPTRAVADKLLEIFNQKAQLFWPVLHEGDLRADMEAVYNGDNEPYRTFIVRMVVAISLQKLDTQYAGLADSYYLAAMQYFEDIVRPKDLKTLQCLVLMGQYSLLTPTRTPIYYVVGLATRICQQEGLASEKTISTGYNLDPKTIDLRRRIIWTVAAMEYGLAHSMGRPNSFATGDDRMDVDFFSPVDDENITEHGIKPAPPSERKLVAIHFYKMRMCQAEIRRALYEKKRPEPKNDSHPWYQRVEKMNKDWLDASPENPAWCKPWFTGRYHQMRIFMYRPSPQVPKPSPRAAKLCYESAAFIVNLSSKQMESGIDITWVFLLTVNMSLNTLLWSVSFPVVRQEHPREEVEKLVSACLDVLDRCAERWPGTASTSQLYQIFSKACLQSYESRQTPGQPANFFTTPPSFTDHQSPPDAFSQTNSQQPPYANPPQFSYVFDSPPEAMNTFAFDPNFPPPQPTFRSNSIFCNPASNEPTGRRFSYFPPDFTQPGEGGPDDPTPPATTTPEQHMASPPDHLSDQLPTPPDSALTGNMTTPGSVLSPPSSMTQQHTPNMQHASPVPMSAHTNMSPPQKPGLPQRGPTFSVPPTSQSALAQRPLPAPNGIGDWFSPPPPFISPFSFGNMSNSFFNDGMSAGPGNYGDMSGSGLGLQNLDAAAMTGPQFDYNFTRQGSLTQSQQLELMNVLETEGMTDIDAFLSGNTVPNTRWY
ncbi:fungal-specific transcription factor domain-containing protein [Ilyonectria robusta]|uniref:fungal-specific transcription factor domain-containing protein n=1 Tax=Ilyonectria robusta TaxID=1079257 RepID=UPI001E8EE491|nr:fungal-specific transcription factor domain-containing protein [Ilyonectria robusta]KAH8737171.1 fungal-specific transcription factor domain-containing protein [Ilyonectria robusta]